MPAHQLDRRMLSLSPFVQHDHRAFAEVSIPPRRHAEVQRFLAGPDLELTHAVDDFDKTQVVHVDIAQQRPSPVRMEPVRPAGLCPATLHKCVITRSSLTYVNEIMVVNGGLGFFARPTQQADVA